jgi:hypothetical protein
MRRWKVLGMVLLLGACGSKDSISLSASVSNINLTLEQKALGTFLSGGFDLHLEVGPEADSGATVQLQSFSLVSATSHATLIPALDAAPAGGVTSIQVGKGESKTISFTLDATKPVSATQADLCAGKVQIVGSVTDDLNGGETEPLQSQAVTITGC